MRQTSNQKTMGATDLVSGGLSPFQATEKSPSFVAPPQGGNRGPPGAFPKLFFVALTRSPDNEITQEALTEVDRIAAFATQLDALLAGIEEEAIRTVAIHLFVQLTGNSDTVDISKLATETSLSVRQVKRSLYNLVLTGKVRRLHGKNPRRYELLIKGAQHETQTKTHRHS